MIYENYTCRRTGCAADDLKCIRCVVESDKGRGCPLYAPTVAFCRAHETVPFEDREAVERAKKAKAIAEQKRKRNGCAIAVLGFLLMMVCMPFAAKSQIFALVSLVGIIAMPVGLYIWNKPLAEAIGAIGTAWAASATISEAINNLADMDKEK